MDFGALPPEVNSGRMYAGAGSGTLVAAATAWDELAAELSTAAASYQATVSELTYGSWRGASSTLMSAAAAPYVEWMNATAAQAEQTANQARSAAVAYEAAFTATVPPPVIALNRTVLASLVATNIIGQNTPAIAATEAHYGEMWAQDAAAMYAYAGAAATATKLTPFTAAPQNTNPAATVTQAAAVTHASATPAANAQTALSTIPNLLQSLTAGPTSEALTQITASLIGLYAILDNGPLTIGAAPQLTAFGLLFLLGPVVGTALGPVVKTLSAAPAAAGLASSSVGSGVGSSTLVGSHGLGLDASAAVGGRTAGASAGLGQAAAVGKLSVPLSWGTPPAIRLATATLPAAGLDAVPRAGLAGSGGAFGGAPLIGPVGSVVNAPRAALAAPRDLRSKALPPWAENPGTHHHTQARPVPPQPHVAIQGQRDELEQLHSELAKVAMERDAAARLIREAIK